MLFTSFFVLFVLSSFPRAFSSPLQHGTATGAPFSVQGNGTAAPFGTANATSGPTGLRGSVSLSGTGVARNSSAIHSSTGTGRARQTNSSSIVGTGTGSLRGTGIPSPKTTFLPSGTGSSKNSTSSGPQGTGPSTRPQGTGPSTGPQGTGHSTRNPSNPSTNTAQLPSTSNPGKGSSSQPPQSANGTAATTSLPGTGVLPFSTITSGSSQSTASTSGVFTWSGSWSVSTTESSQPFPFFLVPTTTIPSAAATSEAALLAPLFFALQADREWITDPKLKSQYIDNLDNVKSELFALFNDLDVQPPADAGCSNTKRKRNVMSERKLRAVLAKRSFISGLTDLIGDVAKTLACAIQVVNNLVDAVKVPEPPISEIEALTDALVDLGTDLQNDDKQPSNSGSNTAPSTTQGPSSTQSSSSQSTCTASSAVPECTETISLSTSYISGNSASPMVSTVTSTVCSTITACGTTAATATTTVSTSGNYTIFCGPTCSACVSNTLPVQTASANANSTKREDVFARNEIFARAILNTPRTDSQADTYVIKRAEQKGAVELAHRQEGILSSSVTTNWLAKPENVFVAGLFGCTAVVIVSEGGVWMGHFYEVPSFQNADLFPQHVINPLKTGDPATFKTPKFTSPFGLAQQNGILSSGNKPQIFISTPFDPATTDGTLLYTSQINQIKDTLIGNGAPWQGLTPTVRGYSKPTSEADQLAMEGQARSKVLIEYYNDVIDELADEPSEKQQATWRVWLERSHYEPDPETWDATPQQSGCSVNQKRQVGAGASGISADGGACLITIPASGSATGTASGSGPVTTTAPGRGGSTVRPSNGTITAPPSTTTSATKPTISCYPFEDPDAGDSTAQCQCNGFTGFYPTLTSTSGQSSYNLCGYTAAPTPATTTPTPFTTTESNGDVVSCASYTYFNFAVNTDKSCAGSTTVVSTDASIASVYAASTSSAAAAAASSAAAASASASWAAAAAVPSAGCYILNDDGWGDLTLLVYGVNGWAGNDGGSLEQQESGCGIFGGWDWQTDGQSMFDGQWRDVQYASFGLSFVKAGCVERAVHSAGGPEPGSGPGQIQCQDGSPTLDQLSVPDPSGQQNNVVARLRARAGAEAKAKAKMLSVPRTAQPTSQSASAAFDVGQAVKAVSKAQVPNLQAVAGGTWPTGTLTDGTAGPNTAADMLGVKLVAASGSNATGPDSTLSGPAPNPSLVQSANAALPHLIAQATGAVSATGVAATATATPTALPRGVPKW